MGNNPSSPGVTEGGRFPGSSSRPSSFRARRSSGGSSSSPQTHVSVTQGVAAASGGGDPTRGFEAIDEEASEASEDTGPLSIESGAENKQNG